MKKRKGKPDDSLGYIYITYDAEMGQNDPGYITRWDFQKKVSNRVSHFVRKLHKHFGIHKNVFEMTLNMNYSTGNKYYDIPENCCLSRDAIDRMAVCIILLEPPLNKNREFIESCKKAGINSKGVIPTLRDDELEDLRSEFCDTFGTFGYQLTHSFKSVKKVLKLNECYYDKFSTKNKKNNDK